jgi:hypothetical protein
MIGPGNGMREYEHPGESPRRNFDSRVFPKKSLSQRALAIANSEELTREQKSGVYFRLEKTPQNGVFWHDDENPLRSSPCRIGNQLCFADLRPTNKQA